MRPGLLLVSRRTPKTLAVPQDPDCPTFRFDLDCDSFTTALDLAVIIDHLFSSGEGPCDPCEP